MYVDPFPEPIPAEPAATRENLHKPSKPKCKYCGRPTYRQIAGKAVCSFCGPDHYLRFTSFGEPKCR